MKLLNFTIIKLTLALIIGIVIGYRTAITVRLALMYCAIGFSITVLSYGIAKFRTSTNYSFGIVSFLFTIAIGLVTVAINNQKQYPNHYLNYLNETDNYSAVLKIEKRLKSDYYNYKFIAQVKRIDTIETSGKLLLNIARDSISKPLEVDDEFIIRERFTDVSGNKNPFQFNYNSYLQRQYIYKQVYVTTASILPLQPHTKTVAGYAANIRARINTVLQSQNFNPQALAVVNALILGQRQDIDRTTYNNYINAGVIHILAVSGLHVGIILMLLHRIFKPLERIRHGRNIKALLIIILLWCFAIIAGLSASVTRAVMMFSVVAIVMHLKRPTNIYNTLTLSAFAILLVKPLFIFDVGFQLSYLAVLSIVSFQPILYQLIPQPKFYITNKLWEILTVTIAAQIGVFPISLFYFHQFPSLFFISNIVIIPVLGILLSLGLLVVVLALLNCLPIELTQCFEALINTLNYFVAWVGSKEQFLLKDLSFNSYQVLGFYAVIICFYWLIKQRKGKPVILLLSSIVVLQLVFLYNRQSAMKTQYTIIFNKSRQTVIGKHANRVLNVYSSMDSVAKLNTIKDYCIGNFINTVHAKPLQHLYTVQGNYLLLIDSSGVYQTSIKADYILLTQSPKLNLARLIDSVQPKLIFADGSNYKSYVKRWEATCRHKKTPFYSTYKNGAYIFE